jgi:hypothetical protein
MDVLKVMASMAFDAAVKIFDCFENNGSVAYGLESI